MKFKYKGHAPIKDIDLVLEGVLDKNKKIYPEEIIEIPDDKKLLIQKFKIDGLFEEVKGLKKFTKSKKEVKEEE